ncbi:MAG: M48 family metalloprotease [Bdellovibrionales bacterium]
MMSHLIKPWLFLSTLSITLLMGGFFLAERKGLLVGFAIVISINFLVYFYGDIRLRKIFGGQVLLGQDAWQLEETVTQLSHQARIPRPQIILLPHRLPTTFSTGRNWQRGTIYITEGLLKILTTEEVRAVLAFEIAKIKRLDTLTFGISSSLSGALMAFPIALDRWFLSSPLSRRNGAAFLLQSMTSWFASLPIHLSVASAHYYAADALGAKLTGEPQALAQALWKLHSYAGSDTADIPPSTGHIFIVNPLHSGQIYRPFVAHPPVEKRIEKLVGYFPI